MDDDPSRYRGRRRSRCHPWPTRSIGYRPTGSLSTTFWRYIMRLSAREASMAISSLDRTETELALKPPSSSGSLRRTVVAFDEAPPLGGTKHAHKHRDRWRSHHESQSPASRPPGLAHLRV